MLTLARVNQELRKSHPKMELLRGNGYFYVHSHDEGIALQLAALYSTSIPVNSINHMTLEGWIAAIQTVLSDWERFEGDRKPVK